MPSRVKTDRQVRVLVVLAASVTACGGDDTAATGQGGGPPPPPPAAAGAGSQLVPKMHIEDRVSDDAERATIRHQFHDHDFEDSNRDPFTSAMLSSAGSGNGSALVPVKMVECHSRVVAPNYSYADLKLVGIIHQGIQNKVLMMDPGNLGRIIATGECVGKEKAVVREITQNYVMFLVAPESGPGQGAAEEHPVKLHDHDLDTTTQTDLSQPSPEPESTPVLPANVRPAPGSSPAPSR